MQHRKLQAVFEPSRKALKELAQKEPWWNAMAACHFLLDLLDISISIVNYPGLSLYNLSAKHFGIHKRDKARSSAARIHHIWSIPLPMDHHGSPLGLEAHPCKALNGRVCRLRHELYPIKIHDNLSWFWGNQESVFVRNTVSNTGDKSSYDPHMFNPHLDSPPS